MYRLNLGYDTVGKPLSLLMIAGRPRPADFCDHPRNDGHSGLDKYRKLND
jgi:hypothetical protein